MRGRKRRAELPSVASKAVTTACVVFEPLRFSRAMVNQTILKGNQDTIEIEGDLRNKVLKIKATGTVAWTVAIGAIGIAVALLLTTGGTAAPVSGVVGIGAISVLGVSTATSAVAIAVAAGGIGALNSLRRYKVLSRSGDKLILSRR